MGQRRNLRFPCTCNICPEGGQRPFPDWRCHKSPAFWSTALHSYSRKQNWRKEFQPTSLSEEPKWHLTKMKKHSPSQVRWLQGQCLFFARKFSLGSLVIEWWVFFVGQTCVLDHSRTYRAESLIHHCHPQVQVLAFPLHLWFKAASSSAEGAETLCSQLFGSDSPPILPF